MHQNETTAAPPFGKKRTKKSSPCLQHIVIDPIQLEARTACHSCLSLFARFLGSLFFQTKKLKLRDILRGANDFKKFPEFYGIFFLSGFSFSKTHQLQMFRQATAHAGALPALTTTKRRQRANVAAGVGGGALKPKPKPPQKMGGLILLVKLGSCRLAKGGGVAFWKKYEGKAPAQNFVPYSNLLASPPPGPHPGNAREAFWLKKGQHFVRWNCSSGLTRRWTALLNLISKDVLERPSKAQPLGLYGIWEASPGGKL